MGLEFAGYDISNQLFYVSRHSFAIVNIRPLLNGHVLVCPKRRVERQNQLTLEEYTDLFNTVFMVSKCIERFYGAGALNIAIQDGALAGQTIPHVHVHIIPRITGDLPNAQEIYKLLNENQLEQAQREMRSQAAINDNRAPQSRSPEEMREEASSLNLYMTTTPKL